MNPEIFGLSDNAQTSIEIAARKLIRKGVFNKRDFDDIRSEITLYTLRQLPRYDPNRAKLSTFINMVVSDGSKHVLRDYYAEKRKWRRQCASLDASRCHDEDGNEITLLHLLDTDAVEIRRGKRNRPRNEEIMLKIDVAAVVSTFPPKLRDCCDAIMAGCNISQIAREREMPRSTFRGRIIAPIRHALKGAGLDDWL